METVCTHVAQGSGELAAPTAGRECGETQAYLFGPFRFIPARRVLLFDDIPQRIGGRAIDILAVLLERAGEPVSKRELMDRVWPTTVVEDGNLKVNVAALRNALGGFASGSQYIATVNGRGYCFVGAVHTSAGSHPKAASSAPVQDKPGIGAAHADILQLIDSLRAQCEQVRALQHAVEVLQRERDRDHIALQSMRAQLELAIQRSTPGAHWRGAGMQWRLPAMRRSTAPAVPGSRRASSCSCLP